MDLLLCLSCCAVDVFVLISGFFLSEKQSRSLGKPFSLYLQVVLFSFASYCVMICMHEATFKPLHIGITILPHNYFVVLYIALYLISPLINKFLLSLSRSHYSKLLFVTIFLFSVYNAGIDLLQDMTGRELTGSTTIGIYGTQYGYTIVNFVMIYAIGGYLKCFGFPSWIKKFDKLLIVFCTFTIYIWRVFVHGGLSATSYCNPFMILLAVCTLSVFADIKKESKVINELAKAAFTCYLFHLVIISRIGVRTFAASTTIPFLLHFIGSIVGIYIVSYLIYKVYNLIFNSLIRCIDKISLSYEENTSLILKR